MDLRHLADRDEDGNVIDDALGAGGKLLGGYLGGGVGMALGGPLGYVFGGGVGGYLGNGIGNKMGDDVAGWWDSL